MATRKKQIERFSPAMESALRGVRARVVEGQGFEEAARRIASARGFALHEVEKAYKIRWPKPFKQPEKIDRHRPQAYPKRVAAWVTEEQRAVFNKIGSKGLRMLLDGTTLVTVLRQVKPQGEA